jgi:hypothetical protein
MWVVELKTAAAVGANFDVQIEVVVLLEANIAVAAVVVEAVVVVANVEAAAVAEVAAASTAAVEGLVAAKEPMTVAIEDDSF